MARVLVLYAHPNEGSYVAALHRTVLAALQAGGHQIEDVDLYAEGFQPILTREERLAYHDLDANTRPVAKEVARLQAADALVIVAPVWNFGFPAILKGYFDRVFLPGVSFRIEGGRAVGALTNIRSIAAVMTYGAPRLPALLMGDPPRRIVKSVLRATVAPGARVRFLAHYGMNRSTDATRRRFMDRVEAELRGL